MTTVQMSEASVEESTDVMRFFDTCWLSFEELELRGQVFENFGVLQLCFGDQICAKGGAIVWLHTVNGALGRLLMHRSGR